MPTDPERWFIRFGLEGPFRPFEEDDVARMRDSRCHTAVLAASPEEAERKSRELDAYSVLRARQA